MASSFTTERHRGLWLGVCRALADRSDVPVSLVRLGVVLLVLCGLGLPGILAYVVIGILARL
jgi:phage shock protein C